MRIPQLSIRWDFYMRIPRLSIRWDFYMRIPRLSILLTHMRFLYGDPSAINQMGFLYEDPPATSIAHPYEIFIWGSPSYQYCSPIWDFYMGISQLSISSMSIKPGGHSIIDEHQTRWAFNHRWASNPMSIQSSVSIKSVDIQSSMSIKSMGIQSSVGIKLMGIQLFI